MPVGLVLAIGIVAISSAGILVRLLPGVPALSIAAWRLGLSALVTVVAVAVVGRRSRAGLAYTAGEYAPYTVRSALAGLFLAAHFSLWITSLKLTTVASSVVLATTTPMWVSVVSHFFLGERNTAREWLGVASGVLGGVLVGAGDFGLTGRAVLGDALALLSAWAVSGYFLLGRQVRRRVSLLQYTVVAYAAGALALLPVAWAVGGPLTRVTGREFLLLLCFAVVPQLVGHNALNWALARMKASVVTLSVLGEAVLTGIAAAVIFGEYPPALALVGYILILSGICLATARGEAAPAG